MRPQRMDNRMRSIIAAIAATAITVTPLAIIPAGARDDGRYANSPLKSWFDQLASGKGLCCSFADGVTIEDVDWDTQNVAVVDAGSQSHFEIRYRVRLNGQWIVVPPAALVTEPNKFGPAVVWPYKDSDGATLIRCFMPGAGT
jgi:hypothetical protein